MKLAPTPVPLETSTPIAAYHTSRTHPRPLSAGRIPSQTFAYDARCEATVSKSHFGKMNLWLELLQGKSAICLSRIPKNLNRIRAERCRRIGPTCQRCDNVA